MVKERHSSVLWLQNYLFCPVFFVYIKMIMCRLAYQTLIHHFSSMCYNIRVLMKLKEKCYLVIPKQNGHHGYNNRFSGWPPHPEILHMDMDFKRMQFHAFATKPTIHPKSCAYCLGYLGHPPQWP